MTKLLRAVRALTNLTLGLYRLTVVASVNLFRRRCGAPPLTRAGRMLLGATSWLIALILMASANAPTVPVTRASAAPPPVAVSAPVARAVPAAARVEPQRGAPVVPHPPIAGQAVTVVRVIDGDTFELSDGRTVRVLGIDSCEMSTPAGADAKAAAERLLRGTVYLLTEPGVTTDRYDRLLRYVQTSAGDLGTEMVGGTHTSVYDGRNDASATYVSKLRSLDGSPARVCGEEPKPEPEAKPIPMPKAPGGPFKNCAAARAAGAAPLVAGSPGYSTKLDRDKDGRACE